MRLFRGLRLVVPMMVVSLSVIGGVVPIGQAQATIDVPILVNVLAPDSTPIPAVMLNRYKEGVTANLKDANRILSDQKCGFQIGASNVTFKVHYPDPKKSQDWSSFQQGSSKLSEMWTWGIAELEKAHGKGKGQKIFLANELKKSNGQGIPGLGADGRPASMFAFDTLFAFRGAASDGQFLLHELGHNADLKHEGASGTFMMETLGSENTLGVRNHPLITQSRTIRADQCDKLKAYWQGRTGPKPKADPKDDGKTGGDKVGFYDSDGNCRLGDGEFLAAMDDWIGAEIADPLFLGAMDAWIQQTNVCDGGAGDGRNTASIPGALTPVCLLDGLSEPCGQIRIRQPEINLGLAFGQSFTIPAGATLDLNVSSTTGGLRFSGGHVGYSGLEGTFQHAGEGLFARLVARQAVRLDPVRELLRLGIALTAPDTASAQIRIAGTLIDPAGTAIRSFTWTLEIVAMLQGLGTDGLSVWRIASAVDSAGAVTFTATGTGIRAINVQLFDLSGRLIDERTSSGRVLHWMPRAADGSPPANGVYLYALTFKGADDVLRDRVKKMVLIR